MLATGGYCPYLDIKQLSILSSGGLEDHVENIYAWTVTLVEGGG